jgi:hypothetical protein
MTWSTSVDLDLAARITVLHIILLVCLFLDTVSSAGYIPFRPKSLGESQYLEQRNFSGLLRIESDVKKQKCHSSFSSCLYFMFFFASC